MFDKKISPALSKLEIRAKDFKMMDNHISNTYLEINRHEIELESLKFELAELNHTRDHICSRISELIKSAISEGYSEQRVCSFIKCDLKLKCIIPYLDKDVQDMFSK